MKEECKVFCVNLILWSIVAQKGTNILIFYILEYGAENGAESGAKQYFMFKTSYVHRKLLHKK